MDRLKPAERGDLVTVTIQGGFGKPRPALIIQANQFNEHTSVTVLPITGTIVNAPLLRITLLPGEENGLQKTSQVMVDKAMTIKRDKIRATFGRVDDGAMIEIERCLAVFLGIAK